MSYVYFLHLFLKIFQWVFYQVKNRRVTDDFLFVIWVDMKWSFIIICKSLITIYICLKTDLSMMLQWKPISAIFGGIENVKHDLTILNVVFCGIDFSWFSFPFSHSLKFIFLPIPIAPIIFLKFYSSMTICH